MTFPGTDYFPSIGSVLGPGSFTYNLSSGSSFTINDSSGTAIFTATDGSPDTAKLGVGLQVYAGTAIGNSQTYLSVGSGATAFFGTDGSGNFQLLDQTGALLIKANSGTGVVFGQSLLLTGSAIISQFKGINTAGVGVVPIYQVGNGVGATTTQTVTYTPLATAGCYIVSVLIQVTTAGTSTIPTLSYHDASGNPITSQPMSMKQVSTVNAPVTSIIATGYWAYDYPVSVDNSGSPITVVITPTGSTFNYEVFIRQVR